MRVGPRRASCIQQLESRRLLAARFPDPTFGQGGKIITGPVRDLFPEANGGFITSDGGNEVLRFNSQGSLESSVFLDEAGVVVGDIFQVTPLNDGSYLAADVYFPDEDFPELSYDELQRYF